jgi:hypothetical protein
VGCSGAAGRELSGTNAGWPIESRAQATDPGEPCAPRPERRRR